MITHLLCVDAAQRYTIDEFLAHPWITTANLPPPVPTPRVEVQDSPLLQALRGHHEMRSPGLATLKEAFDVTYAVHRMEEEGARRRAYNGPGGAGRGFLQGLNEAEESEEEEDQMVLAEAKKRHGEHVSRAIASQWDQRGEGRGELEHAGRAGVRDRGVRRSGGGTFDLDIDHATLIGRRHKRGGALEGSPLVPGRAAEGTPMQID